MRIAGMLFHFKLTVLSRSKSVCKISRIKPDFKNREINRIL